MIWSKLSSRATHIRAVELVEQMGDDFAGGGVFRYLF